MTLKEAIEAAGGVGKKLNRNHYAYPYAVTAIGVRYALVTTINGFEEKHELMDCGWSPHTEPKRVVLEYWQGDISGVIGCFPAGVTPPNGYKRRKDLPNLVIEDGKQPTWEYDK